MSTKYMVGIRNKDGKLMNLLFASTISYAIRRYRKLSGDTSEVTAEFVTTPQGYQVTSLRHLKKGTFFIKVHPSYSIGKTVYVKDNYDRSYEKYECYKFYDVNCTRMFHGDMLVTDQMTF